MTEENKEILIRRAKSFLWRLGGYIVAATLTFIVEQLGLLAIPEVLTVIITLVIGELTKYINVNLPELEEKRNQ